jgi:alkylation response protein AidB-like acyl-CoA dehydrogenase
MDFAWSEEQLRLHQEAARFSAGRLAPGLPERERRGQLSRQLWRECAELGVQGMPVPARYGGGELGPLEMVAVLEGLGYGGGDNGLLFSLNAQLWACTMPIVLFGSEEQKQAHLPTLCRGEALAANAMTEPDSGSDAYALRTTARADGDRHYLLDGSKTFVTNAPEAQLFVVYARTGGKAGFAGISCFLLPRDTDGLSVGQPLPKMGLRTSPMAELFLERCRVPRDALLGREGSGAVVFNASMEWERLMILASAVGAMQRVVERCQAHARERKLGDTPLARHQVLAHRIVDMGLRLEAARLVLYRAAWRKAHRGSAMLESAQAKLCVSEAYVSVCRDALQVFGGYGYMEELGLERELRDALASTLYSGTSEIQRNIIAALQRI